MSVHIQKVGDEVVVTVKDDEEEEYEGDPNVESFSFAIGVGKDMDEFIEMLRAEENS